MPVRRAVPHHHLSRSWGMRGALIGGESTPCSKHSTAPVWHRVGFVVESAYYERAKAVIESRRPEVSVCVPCAEQFPGVSIAGIGDT